MKIVEILGGRGLIRLPITNEESYLIERIRESEDGVKYDTLDPRDKKLVELLIRRDIVYVKEGKVIFNKLIGPEF